MGLHTFKLANVLSVCLALLLALSPSVSMAQTPEKPELSAEQKKEVGQLLLEAKRAYSSKDYEVALDRLVKAYELYPDANVQRRIGETLERLRKDREALDVYQRVLARDDVESATRSAVERRVNFLEDLFRSRQAVVSVSSTELEATIWVDGEDEPRGSAPLDVRLDPGKHTLRAETEGREPLTFDVRVAEREKLSWEANWPEQTVVEAPAPTAEPESDYTTLGWVAVGTGAVMFGAAATTLILASSRASTLDEYDADRDQPRPDDYGDVESEYNTLVTMSWIGAGIGVVATGIGAILLITSAESAESDVDSTSRIDVAPTDGGARVQWSITW